MHIVGWIAAVLLAAVAGFNVKYALDIAGTDLEGSIECLFTSGVMAAAALAILWNTPAKPRRAAELDTLNAERTPCP